jgi:hypothetical protein
MTIYKGYISIAWSFFFCTAIFFVSFSTLGCGPSVYYLTSGEQDESKMAILERGDSEVRLSRINNQVSNKSIGFGSDWSADFRIYILPGAYKLLVGACDVPFTGLIFNKWFQSVSDKILLFTAEAGHTYRMKYERQGMHWRISIEDTAPDLESTILPSSAEGELITLQGSG